MVLRWYFDGSSKDLGHFCHPGRPSGATKQRPPTRPRLGFDSIGLAVIQRAPSPGGPGAGGLTTSCVVSATMKKAKPGPQLAPFIPPEKDFPRATVRVCSPHAPCSGRPEVWTGSQGRKPLVG